MSFALWDRGFMQYEDTSHLDLFENLPHVPQFLFLFLENQLGFRLHVPQLLLQCVLDGNTHYWFSFVVLVSGSSVKEGNFKK